MLWLASYPRSGNTFFRNVLREVYGIESSTFHDESDYPIDPDFDKYPVVKTHQRPSQLPHKLRNAPAVYLVRDGRDCAVSLAWYRKQLLEPTSDFQANLIEAVKAADGSFFGGWSEHVREWQKKAVLTIKFEELIENPIECIERLRPWIDLPKPCYEKLPKFDDLKTKDFAYGSGVEHGFSEGERRRWREGKFRRGKVGAWLDEMPENIQLAYYAQHGMQLKKMGYWQPNSTFQETPKSQSFPIETFSDTSKTPTSTQRKPQKKRVLIDASKLMGNHQDGIGRYIKELLAAIVELTSDNDEWEIDLSLGVFGTLPLKDCETDILNRRPPISSGNNFVKCSRMQDRVTHASERLKEAKATTHLRAIISRSVRLFILKLIFSVHKRFQKIQNILDGQDSKYDVIHLTLPNNYEFSKRYPGQLVTTVHDLCHIACPELQAPANVRTLQLGLNYVEERHSRYIAVSEATRRAMIDELAIGGNRIETIPNSVSHDWCKPVVVQETIDGVRKSHSIPNGPYFFSVGTIEPRKNIHTLVDAFNQLVEEHPELDVNLVLAGAAGWEEMPIIEQKVMESPRIHYIGFVDDNDLPTLYSAAIATCYISKYEGFGLPILESMACGTPALYGDNSSMPEVAGNSGISVDVDDVSDVARGLYQFASNSELRHELAQRAIDHSVEVNWNKVAELTLKNYERVIKQSANTPEESIVSIPLSNPDDSAGERRAA